METYHGHVRTPADAIVLFEACRIGLLPRVQRRLSEKERQSIRSGSVFVWDEREAGMRRWTDGKSWSASRVSGSFLTYREMEGKRGGGSVAQSSSSRAGKTPESTRGSDDDRADGADEGPDGYRYKPDGLMKQSFSITTSTGQHLHLISYYSRSHPSAVNLQQPSTDPALRNVRPQKGLYPESTVNDQQNLPVVTRGPMAGPPYTISPHPMGGYPRPPPGASHPQSYTPPYAWPPTPLATPPAVPVAYGPGPPYLPPVSAHNGNVPYAQPHHPLPPPPPQSVAHYDRPVHHQHPAETSVPQSSVPVTAGQPPSVPVYPGRSPRLVEEVRQRSPPGYAAIPSASPRVQPQHGPPQPPPQQQGGGYMPGTPSPGMYKQGPPPAPPASLPLASPNPPPKAAAGGNANTTVPSIEALVNGAPPGPLPSIAPSSYSPPRHGHHRAEGPRDIPSDKIGFGGEDMRALRQLDRVFTA